MAIPVRINEDTYEAIEKLAKNDGRSVTVMTNRLLDKALDWDRSEPVLPNNAVHTPVKDETPNLRGSYGLCKVHGIPLTQNGKCMQKGCKYA